MHATGKRDAMGNCTDDRQQAGRGAAVYFYFYFYFHAWGKVVGGRGGFCACAAQRACAWAMTGAQRC